MAFQLTIAEGKDAGKEFVFEQPQVLIGRTAECDIVLYDAGVSRKHARIFYEADAHYVEDMGSSNGTKVNGEGVSRHELVDGDAITLGPVVFKFAAVTAGESTAAHEMGGVAHENTRIFEAPPQGKAAGKAVLLQPENAEPEALATFQRSHTSSMPVVKVPSSPPRSSGSAPARSGAIVARPGADGAVAPRASSGGGMAVRPGPGTQAPARTSGNRPPPPLAKRPPPASTTLSASDRARIKRESPGVAGAFRLFWLEASKQKRIAVIASVSVLVLAGLGGAVYSLFFSDDGAKKPPPEPVMLTRRPVEYSFGLGEGVTYARPDMKVFEFEYVSAVGAVVILHFQCKEISEGEVVVTVNGQDVGKLPPDLINANDVSHELLIPPTALKKGERNKVIFDNVKNPPDSQTWRIWNIWVEIVPLPEGNPDDLLREATNSYQRAQLRFKRKDIGALNRYEAWKDFRNAWLLLQNLKSPRPDLYGEAQAMAKQAQIELDKQCSKLLLEAQSNFNQGNYDNARSTLDHVKDFFPAADQPCPFRADEKKNDLGL